MILGSAKLITASKFRKNRKLSLFTLLTEEYNPYEGEKSSKHLYKYENNTVDLRQCSANAVINRTNTVIYQGLYLQIQCYS